MSVISKQVLLAALKSTEIKISPRRPLLPEAQTASFFSGRQQIAYVKWQAFHETRQQVPSLTIRSLSLHLIQEPLKIEARERVGSMTGNCRHFVINASSPPRGFVRVALRFGHYPTGDDESIVKLGPGRRSLTGWELLLYSKQAAR